MKVLLIGSSVKDGLPNSFLMVFSSLNQGDVEIFDDENLYRKSSLAKNKYFHRLFWRFLALPLQKKIINAIKDKKPDLILVFKGWLIKPRTILKIKKILPKTLIFNLNPDNPFNTWHHGNSNSWIINSIPLYDVYFIWGKFLIEPLLRVGVKKVEYLPFGYDSQLHYAVEINNKEKEFYGSDVAFVGSWDKEREWWLSHLLDYDLKIWGNSWEKADNKLQIKWQKKAVVGEKFSKVCQAAKINLNFIRKQNGDAHNMRTFEVPACGGFILSTRTKEQQDFFNEGKEADYFSTPEELRQKIDFYLKNKELRQKIAEAGRKKLLNSGHSYIDRAKKILEVYQNR